MKFFFPDSHDLVDPSFDFFTETRSETRTRHRDDVYAHELFPASPYNGILVSKAIVDGTAANSGKYTAAQRHRLLRVGAPEFFRVVGRSIETVGDCGAFSYVRDKIPPYSVDEVLDFYQQCRFDHGMAVDHVILGYKPVTKQLSLPKVDDIPEDWRERQRITLALAEDFHRRHRERNCRFTPIGVAQGWSPSSYAFAFERLQRIGYTRIAMGGIVPMKTRDIIDTLAAVSAVRDSSTQIHLLGVTRVEQIDRFAGFGVTSFDSTSPLRQAFKDAHNNYYTLERNYTAIRVPQVEGNPKLGRQIRAGEVDQSEARALELAALGALRRYDAGTATANEALAAVLAYEKLHDPGANRAEAYRQSLFDKPWKNCGCAICKELGVHVILFRGAERNRRRGFHNLEVFSRQLRGRLGTLPPNEDVDTKGTGLHPSASESWSSPLETNA